MYNYNTNAILRTINDLQNKIDRLEQVMSVYPFGNVNIFFYGVNGVFNGLTQNDFPFSLSNELKIFMLESIESMKKEQIDLHNSI